MATYITIETDKRIAYQIDGGDKQTMFANIEEGGYPEPTGTITITQNGTGIDVKDYAEADVNVPGGGYPEPTGTITITQNGSGIDVKDYAEADVNVPFITEGFITTSITLEEALSNAVDLLNLIQTLPENDVMIGIFDRDWTETPEQFSGLWFTWWGSTSNSTYTRFTTNVNTNASWTQIYNYFVPANTKLIITYKPKNV